MAPSAFIPIKALPLTPNGKIDVQALLAVGKTVLKLIKFT
jgi:hypothetical protein